MFKCTLLSVTCNALILNPKKNEGNPNSEQTSPPKRTKAGL